MDAPTCRICGHKHWSRVCDVGLASDARDEDVTKRVTPRDIVTTTVTPKQADLETDNKRFLAEAARLTEEVAALKRELAAARTDEPQTVGATASARRPMNAAERQRKRRAKPG